MVDGKGSKGTIAWAEGDTVLVFNPAEPADGVKVVAPVADATRMTVAIGVAAKRHVHGRPSRSRRGTDAAQRRASQNPRGGGSVGGGRWGAVEGYYLRLMNCTRTGGWVTSAGRAAAPGAQRRRAPPRRGISSRSRGRTPKLAVNNCARTSAMAIG